MSVSACLEALCPTGLLGLRSRSALRHGHRWCVVDDDCLGARRIASASQLIDGSDVVQAGAAVGVSTLRCLRR